MATWHVFRELNVRIRGVLEGSRGAWGFVDDAWLQAAIGRFGPLTHHVQLKASILMDALRANGIAIDARRWEEKLGQVRRIREGCRERMRRRGSWRASRGAARQCNRSWRSSSENTASRS